MNKLQLKILKLLSSTSLVIIFCLVFFSSTVNATYDISCSIDSDCPSGLTCGTDDPYGTGKNYCLYTAVDQTGCNNISNNTTYNALTGQCEFTLCPNGTATSYTFSPAAEPLSVFTGTYTSTYGTGADQTFVGGLYSPTDESTVTSTLPTSQATSLSTAMNEIKPLDTDGLEDLSSGKIGFITVGMSNTQHISTILTAELPEHSRFNPKVVMVDGGKSGTDAEQMANFNDSYWQSTLPSRISAASLDPDQVQVAWISTGMQKTSYALASDDLKARTRQYGFDLARIVKKLAIDYPNIKIIYLSDVTYTGWGSGTGGMPEPLGYEDQFAVRKVIMDQVEGNTVTYNSTSVDMSDSLFARLKWGPNLWRNGQTESDGLSFTYADFISSDCVHPAYGRHKVTEYLIDFFLADDHAGDNWLFLPAAVSSGSGSGNPSSSSGSSTSSPRPPGCNYTSPMGIPDLFQIDRIDDKAYLYFTPIKNNLSEYVVTFGFTPGDIRFGGTFGVGSSTGVNEIEINYLDPKASYYFSIRGGNQCAVGEWSNWMLAPGFKTNFIEQLIQKYYRY